VETIFCSSFSIFAYLATHNVKRTMMTWKLIFRMHYWVCGLKTSFNRKVLLLTSFEIHGCVRLGGSWFVSHYLTFP